MVVTIIYDNFQGEYKEVTYESKFKRINAKGIKEEAKSKLVEKYGQHARNYEIKQLYRENI